MSHTRIASLIVVAFLTPHLALGQSCDSEKHRQFDFWIGDWTVTANGQVAGANTIERILDGCALQENWTGSSGSEGKSFNMFFERDGRWHQTWVDKTGSRLDLSGGLDKQGRMVLSGEMPGNDGGTVLHEIAWTPNDDGTVLQHWRGSKDGGKSWSDLFVGTYTRK